MIYKKITEFLTDKINPSYIIVFGSFAKGSQHQESDIDVAFYSKETSISSYDLFMLAQELASILKIEVDLIDMTHASTVFQAQIYTTGIVIYCMDDELRMNMTMLALSKYAKLNEERENILRKASESGSIYEK
ncbi:type VII toxin-antitoxin system MntA family adenylyltransferase antitoxin [Bacillus sp. 03113]|uniref:type VII toxin-antitoxin system MntA family adenylyltransferase antitoxin n=1 Tax=Bacillus sp. 03113 TaxID=2578211 RepID=UPI001141681B|nr:nucleotidyltransferase domain-containing protein [Bacillus sp. 03113]